ncbi:hypothetical protein M0R88_12555 [Halorussus gelatinilyticus]|uniref:Uncharacterized protein n=1 Tax=Halorussus gelatinilyticus TaxID=2937524 RepID=A0A8U0IEH3_9EURY|nr:hypothetical protein [Halorussus gelatinilyticus]UPV99352.1 hypothetical protein M0R88_12555 [Halorussus gelatinilyticus]
MNGKTFGLLVGIAALSLVAVGSAAAVSSGNCGTDACYDSDSLSSEPLYMMCGGIGCYETDAVST